MPWHVKMSGSCPASKPWAVIKDADGQVVKCHTTKAHAIDHMKALYAQEGPMMNMSGFVAELRDVELRKSGAGSGEYTFTGSAVVFDSWSEPLHTSLGPFRERIMPGAFSQVLAGKPDVRLLFNHNPDQVLARTKSGTLELTEEPDALRVWAKLDPTDPDVQRLVSKMNRGDVDQMSFAFAMDENRGGQDSWYEVDGEIRRDVVSVSDLFDVSAVTYPAYESTTAAVREMRAKAVEQHFQDEEIVARAETDPVDAPTLEAGETTEAAPAETDPADAGEATDAQAETDPAVSEPDALEVLRAASAAAMQEAREEKVRLTKEMLK